MANNIDVQCNFVQCTMFDTKTSIRTYIIHIRIQEAIFFLFLTKMSDWDLRWEGNHQFKTHNIIKFHFTNSESRVKNNFLTIYCIFMRKLNDEKIFRLGCPEKKDIVQMLIQCLWLFTSCFAHVTWASIATLLKTTKKKLHV